MILIKSIQFKKFLTNGIIFGQHAKRMINSTVKRAIQTASIGNHNALPSRSTEGTLSRINVVQENKIKSNIDNAKYVAGLELEGSSKNCHVFLFHELDPCASAAPVAPQHQPNHNAKHMLGRKT